VILFAIMLQKGCLPTGKASYSSHVSSSINKTEGSWIYVVRNAAGSSHL